MGPIQFNSIAVYLNGFGPRLFVDRTTPSSHDDDQVACNTAWRQRMPEQLQQ